LWASSSALKEPNAGGRRDEREGRNRRSPRGALLKTLLEEELPSKRRRSHFVSKKRDSPIAAPGEEFGGKKKELPYLESSKIFLPPRGKTL